MSSFNINEFKVKAKKDVPSKKSATRRKKTQPSEETKKFSTEECTVISPKSIAIIGEGIGISELPEDACNVLAEDVTNKLREVANNCSILLRNSKQRTLLTHDVNQVFEVSNVSPIYGNSFPNGHDFLYLNKEDIFIPEDAEIDIVTLASSNTSVTTPGVEHIKGSWILLDPIEEYNTQAGTSSSSNSCNVKNSTTTSTTTSSNNTTSVNTLSNEKIKSKGSGTSVPQEKTTKPPKTSAKLEDTVNKLPTHLMNYYLQIAKIIIIHNDGNLLRVALKDLRTNPKIAPLCPYFLKLVAISVLDFQGNGHLLDVLIRTVDALVDNPYFSPSSHHLATNRGLTALVNIATEPHVARGWDDMLLRRQSATVLAKVLDHWVIEQKLQENLIHRLSDLMFRGTYTSLKSHFGAVVILSAFGDRVLNTVFWPQIHHYFNLLDKLLNSDTAEDIHFIKGAILMAAEGMFKKFHYTYTTNEEVKRLQDVSDKLYEYFGDTLIPWSYLKVLGTSVYPPVVTVPVETKLPTIRKENTCFDHNCYFEKCNYVTMIQRQMQLPYNLNILRTVLVQKPKTDINSVFTVEPWHSETVRKKKLDNTQKYYDNRVHKFPQMWYRQIIFKCTRTIKNCLPSHKKSGAGDLFMLL